LKSNFFFNADADSDPGAKPTLILILVRLQKVEFLHKKIYLMQGCGSGSVLDPYSIGSVDPDP
jgi:hypothetical protein